jgi:hypothetical protein
MLMINCIMLLDLINCLILDKNLLYFNHGKKEKHKI